MLKATVIDVLLGRSVALVENIEFGPEKATDTTDAVAPSEAASVGEFGEGELVGA